MNKVGVLAVGVSSHFETLFWWLFFVQIISKSFPEFSETVLAASGGKDAEFKLSIQIIKFSNGACRESKIKIFY